MVKRLCSAEKNKGPSGHCVKDNENDYGCCVNGSPLSKLRRISLVNQQPKGLMSQSPSHNKNTYSWKDGENDFLSENESPQSKLRRISLYKRVNIKMESPTKENTNSWRDGENNFVCENESPPSKSRRISLVKRVNMKMESPTNNKKRPDSGGLISASGGLISACKELVNLAVSRGGLDDITVMIIDLHHFRFNG